MKCPFCGVFENKVVDSRLTRDGQIVRRRRECESCARRFTTYERVEELLPLVVKKDGRREAFDRAKVIAGISRACEKRPISVEAIEALVDRLELALQEKGEKEIPSSAIGEMIMRELHRLDEVAYVRFASVYRQFRDISQFMDELKDLLSARERTAAPGGAGENGAHESKVNGKPASSRTDPS